MINKAAIMINTEVNECKELIEKGLCEKGYIWNPSNCEFECDKSCNVGEYSDYENCKCRKSLNDKLVEKCSEDIDGNEMSIQVLHNIHSTISHSFCNNNRH